MEQTLMSDISQVKENEKIISSVTMMVTLISFAMLFATLMMGFAIFRFTAPIWPPAGMDRPSLVMPGISTLFIILSSISFIWFEQKIKRGVSDRKGLLVTLVLGIAFMASQFIFWNQLKTHGIFVSSGIFPSIIYAFTWIHAAHIVLAIGLLAWLYTAIKKNDSMTPIRVSNVGKFWHFLGIVWLIMFVTIFVL
jgi:cytochrome c oxidase subunit 3